MGVWLSLTLWGFFQCSFEMNAYHIPGHIWSCRNMAFFPGISHSTHKNHNHKTFKLLHPFYNSKCLQFVLKTRGNEDTQNNIISEGLPQIWTGNSISFNKEDLHYTGEPLSPKTYMEIQFPKAAELVCNLSRGSWHCAWVATNTYLWELQPSKIAWWTCNFKDFLWHHPSFQSF